MSTRGRTWLYTKMSARRFSPPSTKATSRRRVCRRELSAATKFALYRMALYSPPTQLNKVLRSSPNQSPNCDSVGGQEWFSCWKKFSKSPSLVWHETNKREKSAQSLLRDETSAVDLFEFFTGRLPSNGKLFLVMGAATDLVACIVVLKSSDLLHVVNALRYFGVYYVPRIKNQEV